MTDANFVPHTASATQGPPDIDGPGDLGASGTWTITQNNHAPIHTFTAPEDGWRVTSHIIELPSQLLIIDAQYRLPYAREVVRRASELKKADGTALCHALPPRSSARSRGIRHAAIRARERGGKDRRCR